MKQKKTYISGNGDGERLVEFELPTLLLSKLVGCLFSPSKSKVFKFVNVPENLFEIVGAEINESGKATDGFWARTCCKS